jgi:YcaO-like protein with predicted kinase domain
MSGLVDARTPKSGVGTAWRSMSADETLDRIQPFHDVIGLTRVADVTGLDRIGIPVWQAIRPNGRGLSVAQGKGLTPALAMASAAMESFESHHAEFIDQPCRIESYDQLCLESDEDEVVDPRRLPLSRHSVWSGGLPIPWIRAHDVVSDEPAWAPFELVHANSTLPRVPGSGSFVCSTNGLASGNTLAEAVLHGLCELVERDAHALWRIDDKNETGDRVDLATVVDPGCVGLLTQYDDAGIDVAVWDMTSDIGVPAYRAIIVDREAVKGLDPVPSAYGAGCHVDPSVALLRTLTEAAQSRLTAIAGSRDDLTRARYDEFQGDEALDDNRRIADLPSSVDATRHTSLAGPTIEEDIEAVLARLRMVGLNRVFMVDLSRPGWPMAAARVIVPGLEGTSVVPSYRPGCRARDAFARHTDATAP